MGSYPFLSKRHDRFEVYTETAIGYHSDHDRERELYDEWMENAERFLEGFGPLVKEILAGPDVHLKLIPFSEDLDQVDEREAWDRSPCRFRMVMREVCKGFMDMTRVDVIVAIAEIPSKEDVEALKEEFLKAARTLCKKPKGLLGF